MQFSTFVKELSNRVEDMVAWLISKEDELQKRPDEESLQEAPFEQVINEYSFHEKFMTEISEYCHTIVKCKEEARHILDHNDKLSDEDRDEIGIQIDVITVLYDKLQILIADRLHCLQRILNDRQRSKIDRLEKWLTSIELKLASSDNIGPDYKSLQRQITEIDELKSELKHKQEFLDVISRLILFEDVDIGSSQIKSSSCENFESRLESLNDRWTQICQTVDARYLRLNKADSIWNLLHLEGPQLDSWLTKIRQRLGELSSAIKDASDSRTDKSFLIKLQSRSEKIDAEIKSEQLRYTSLEHRIRSEIEEFDDPCSMFVIELEKNLEDMQENWNLMLREKRNLEFQLQALLNICSQTNDNVNPIIPIPKSITTKSNNDLRFKFIEKTASGRKPMYQDSFNGDLNSPPSIDHDDSKLDDSLSDIRGFEKSSSSQDTKSLSYINPNDHRYRGQSQPTSVHDNDSHDEISSTTNLSLSNTGNSYNEPSNNDLDHTFVSNEEGKTDRQHVDLVNELSIASHDHDGNHSCRVEDWKHSLESFSSWLKDVEYSLGIIEMADPVIDRNNLTRDQTWSKMNIVAQVTLVKDIEIKIKSSCQDEFDSLFLQGQQIIEDLMPELGENDLLESNLKDILAGIEMRYNSVKRCLLERRRELADREKWSRLLALLQNTSQFLISQLEEVVSESEIGVDLITLAQQQDQLMHSKNELEANTTLKSCVQESKLFLKLYDMLAQIYGQAKIKDPASQSAKYMEQDSCNLTDIWSSLREFKDDIETHLDRLTLHYAELSQTIEDRLRRLDEISREMHALQRSIQELATKLQMSEILKSGWVTLDNLSIEELSEQLEDLKLYRERLASVESLHKGMNSIVDWMDQYGAPLSQSNLSRIDELNSIWSSIQSSVEDRQKSIEHAFDEQSCSEQKFLAVTVSDLSNWERRVATSKVPYFIDHLTGETHWDHPKFTKILEAMNEFKHYAFSAYRTAVKLRTIQRSLGLDKLMLEHLKDIINRFDSSLSASGADVASIRIEQVIPLLQMIFEHIHTNESPKIDVPVAIDLTLNWLLNLYDATRSGQLSALSLKVGLTLICCATLEEKYTFMFETISDAETGTVDAKKLSALFEICTRIPTYLGESESFGGSSLIQNSVRDCLAASKFNPQRPNDLGLNDYLNWLKSEPQFIIWLSVLHRLLISENTAHKQKCQLCGSNPIIGLRYRCLKCFKFNICQKCFLTGRHVYEHHDPDKHPFREYCCPSSMSDQLRDFSKIFRSALI